MRDRRRYPSVLLMRHQETLLTAGLASNVHVTVNDVPTFPPNTFFEYVTSGGSLNRNNKHPEIFLCATYRCLAYTSL